MDILLTDSEARVLGCLLEKEMATPDYYPLTLNSLLSACNQKSNRNPVVSYDEEAVRHALAELQENRMVRQSNVSRVPKYEQIFSEGLKLVPREKAILCVLLLRGPQTVGEVRGRTERLYAFGGLEEVQETLDTLEEAGLVQRLARQPGRKESRYVQLMQGEPVAEPAAETRESRETVIVRSKSDQAEELREEIETLREELAALRREFEEFKGQFT